MADKDVETVGGTLFPLFDRVITTEPFPPRSAAADGLAQLAGRLGVEATAEPNPEDAFARAMAVPENTVFIGGSLYLAGSAIAYFDSHSE